VLQIGLDDQLLKRAAPQAFPRSTQCHALKKQEQKTPAGAPGSFSYSF
jgi:hypothetical protein